MSRRVVLPITSAVRYTLGFVWYFGVGFAGDLVCSVCLSGPVSCWTLALSVSLGVQSCQRAVFNVAPSLNAEPGVHRRRTCFLPAFSPEFATPCDAALSRLRTSPASTLCFTVWAAGEFLLSAWPFREVLLFRLIFDCGVGGSVAGCLCGCVSRRSPFARVALVHSVFVARHLQQSHAMGACGCYFCVALAAFIFCGRLVFILGRWL